MTPRAARRAQDAIIADATAFRRRSSLDLQMEMPDGGAAQQEEEPAGPLPTSPAFDAFDEESRFELHNTAHVADSLVKFTRIRGVKSATIVDMPTGAVIITTTDVAEAAKLAQHVPVLMHRAQTVCRHTTAACQGSGADEASCALSMLLISTKKTELLLCADAASGAAVVVEQDRAAGGADVPAVLKATAGAAAAEDPESQYRRLLVGQPGEALSPGAFLGTRYDEE